LKRALPLLLSLAVAAASLSITALAWRHERASEEAALRASFDFGLRQATSRIEQRMAGFEQMLRGVQGLFVASGPVAHDDFDRYVDALLAGADFSGMQAIAYGPLLSAEDLPAHVLAQRRGGDPSYRLRPPGARGFYVPVTYIAPAAGPSLSALGFDIASDPVRRAALEKSRDSGSVAITGRLRLVTEPAHAPQYGFLMVLPLYAPGQPADSVAARRRNVVGWVWAGFRVGDLMSSLYGEGTPGLDLRLYDGVVPNGDALLYRSIGVEAEREPARFQAQEYIGVAGQSWTVQVRSTPEFEARHHRESARIIGIAGIGLSLLLAVLAWQLATARARAHSVARVMTRELRDSEARYRRIVETANEGIWLVNASACLSFVNPKLLRMLGQTSAQMLDRPLADFLEDPGGLLSAAELARRQPGTVETAELRMQRRGGEPVWVSMSITPVFDEAGAYAGALGMVTDISERKKAEAGRLLLEAQLRESQKMEAIGTLAGGIAHDFNNILAAILGNVSLAGEHLGEGHPAAPPLRQIELAGVRARSLVQKILAFSRMQPHELVSQPMRPMIEESIALLRSTLPATVELVLELESRPLMVSADATHVQQILLNLCTNAWHALQGSSGRITIGLEALRLDAADARRLGELQPGPCVHLWVSDTGCGMDEATKQRVFEPFFTTKRVGQGTGLGLSVVHGIVTGHAGAIRVESEPGRGSSFHLYFPEVPARPAAPARAEAAAAVPAQGAGQRVMVVDDDPAMLLMVEGLLQRAGYRVTAVDQPREAAARLRREPSAYDLVVTDYNMPELTGMELAAEIAAIRADLPVVISSGYISEEMRGAAHEVGVKVLMQKEYTLEQLGSIVHAVLNPAQVNDDPGLASGLRVL